ncbi:MAG: SMC-Scp complex subunit ScpB [Candidatus Bathyarchaeota archaeon]|nr:SMC-Scp complex subunit ScpB [Candidatus Termiticorpusculum sp.]
MERPDNQSNENQAEIIEEQIQGQTTEIITNTTQPETIEEQQQTDQPLTDQDADESENIKEDNTAQAEIRLKQNLALIEAALYVAGRPLDINELGQVVNSRSKKKVKKYTELIMKEYVARNSPMEILALKDERYVLQVKAEFTPLIKKLVNRPLLSSGPLKTLSYIAFRQPITQKRVIEVRGQHAYDHVKQLKDMGLIVTERVGRSVALKTTDYFADYFGLTQDTSAMKRELKRIFGDALKEEEQP